MKITGNRKGRESFSLVLLLSVFVLSLAPVQNLEQKTNPDHENPLNSFSKFGSPCLPIFQPKIMDDLNSPPRCNVTFFNPPPTCINRGENVVQVVGPFSGLTLNCTAPYLIYLDFDGFRPTEALTVLLWRDVVEITDEARVNNTYGIKVKSFGLNATVTSIQTLFEQYKTMMRRNAKRKRPLSFFQPNLSHPIIYPRTGRIRIRGMKEEHTKKFQDFYFFFQEPLLGDEISFMENEHTLEPTLISGPKVNKVNDTFILIPCRTSHWTMDVKLRFKGSGAASVSTLENWSVVKVINSSTSTFDPTTGFKIPARIFNVTNAEDFKNGQLQFQCIVISPSGKKTVWEANPKAGAMDFVRGVAVFGSHLLSKPNRKTAQSLHISFDQVSFEGSFQVTGLECSFDQAQPTSSLFVFGHERQQSYVERNFAREFALPMYSNRSYFVQRGDSPVDAGIGEDDDKDILELRLERAPGTGSLYCSNRDNFDFIEYFRSLFIDAKYYFAAGSFQPSLTFNVVPDNTFIRLEKNTHLEDKEAIYIYTFEKVQFICNTLNTYTLNRLPILWFTENSHGVRKLVFKDDMIIDDPLRVHDNSRFETNLTSDVIKIICMGALWQTDQWRHSTLSLNIKDGASPMFVGSKRTFDLPLNSLNESISCVADGDPIPQVWWERNGLNLTKDNSSHVKIALHYIPRVDESSLGKYKCIAQNGYGRIETDFLLQGTSSENPVFYLLAVGLPLFVIFILIAVALSFFARARLRKEILTAEELKDFREGVDASKMNQEKDSPAIALPYTDDFEIPPGKFSIHRDAVLGSGEFGLVMKATVENKPVAVKTVKPDCDKMHVKALIMELKILMYLGKHPRLIDFVGAHTKNIHRGQVYVFVGLCEGGNLLTFLQKNRHNFSKEKPKGNTDYQNNDVLSLDLLHEWAFEIAEGMNYLREKRVIHGDLAARNILLTAERSTKITDFGLSRQLMSYSMYMKKSEEPLPFRWMSLESLESLTFSSESDVWSYGVLLWEIYSLGQVPFPHLEWDIEFVEKLRNGLRMSCPQMISEELFTALLCPCWENEPKNRPNFHSIRSILGNFTERKTKRDV